MQRLSALAIALTIGFTAALGAGAQADDPAGGKPRVSVRVTPERAPPGDAVTIDGVTPLDGKNAMTLRVTKPDGKVVAFDVVPAPDGDYSASFTDTALAGDYTVAAASPSGQLSGSGRFAIEVMEPLDDIEEAEAELGEIAAAIQQVTNEVTTGIERLPDTAARDAVKAKWAATRPKLERAVRDLGNLDDVMMPLKNAAADPAAAPVLKPFAIVLRDWTKSARADRIRIVQQLQASKAGNSRCEAAEHIIEGMNFAAALANLLGGPVNAIKSVLVDFVASQGGALAAKLSERFKFPATEATKVATATAEAQTKGLFKGDRMAVALTARQALADSTFGMAFDFGSFVAQQWFEKYCERLAGSFTGTMHAEFFNLSSKPWWSYDIELEGRLELRYAKGDADAQSLTTKVNGEFIGQAIHFRMQEDSVRLGAPGLTTAAILYKRTAMPMPEILNLLTMRPTMPNGRPVEPKPIDVEGKVAATLVKPYTFFVPVEGEIVQGVLTLRRKPASVDYEAAARVVYVIISPLTPMMPNVTTLELPFKNGEFFLTRAMGDDALQLEVKKTPTALVVDQTVKREKGDGRANGTYRLTLKLCNPEGKC
jgi:hypothetical protein